MILVMEMNNFDTNPRRWWDNGAENPNGQYFEMLLGREYSDKINKITIQMLTDFLATKGFKKTTKTSYSCFVKPNACSITFWDANITHKDGTLAYNFWISAMLMAIKEYVRFVGVGKTSVRQVIDEILESKNSKQI